jgi:hypothetical protein
VATADVPPPGEGLTTVTFAVPGNAHSMTGMDAEMDVLLL